MSARFSDFGSSESVCSGAMGKQDQASNAVSRQISELLLVEQYAS